MGYIYKITNILNDKVYIGQTTQTVEGRWKEHLSKAKNNAKTHFARAINKYGEENFKVETIEECPQIQLNEREIYWIQYYNSFHEGYNSTLGGQGAVLHERVADEIIYKLWDEGLSRKEIAEKTKLPYSYLEQILKTYENYSIEESLRRGSKLIAKSKEKQISQWSLLGDYIATYDSARQAEEKTGLSYKAISRALTHNGTCGGYLWSYGIQEPVIKNKDRIVEQYDLQGNYINTYPTPTIAAQTLGIDPSGLMKVCRGTRKTAGGFIWKFKYPKCS